jgi:uncharacterized protein (TIGR00369 family)
MPTFESLNPDFAAQLKETFARQKVMTTIGAWAELAAPGEAIITLPFREDLCQQHGFIHAGIITTIVDSACGGAALSLMPPGAGVLTVEYKVNLLAPAKGERFIAKGRVLKPGRTLMVCQGEVTAFEGGQEKTIAIMLATMMVVQNRPGIVG